MYLSYCDPFFLGLKIARLLGMLQEDVRVIFQKENLWHLIKRNPQAQSRIALVLVLGELWKCPVRNLKKDHHPRTLQVKMRHHMLLLNLSKTLLQTQGAIKCLGIHTPRHFFPITSHFVVGWAQMKKINVVDILALQKSHPILLHVQFLPYLLIKEKRSAW